MWTYEAPLAEIKFIIEHWLQAPSDWDDIPGFAELDADATQQILEEAGRFATEVLLPINSPGDSEGCHFDSGAVRTPAGYREAYKIFVENGWPSLACASDCGGQGLPQLLNAALYEMLTATCHAWAMYPGLAHGAYECLRAHGSDELKNQYLPKLISGEWLATMCLTEAHAGSDLGLLRTRAELNTESHPEFNSGHQCYQITGNKIFISGGEHDLSENIIHLVLARLPDAPAGARGISLFLVPKLLPDGDRLRTNSVHCDGIERKMGIKGSATCSLNFNGAKGWLIGEPHRGLAAMFVMMNAARLHVALQGIAHAEIAHQNALNYARERLQMRAIDRADATAAADPIIQHPAIRRLLLEQRAIVQAERMIGYWLAHLLDMAEHHPDISRRERSAKLISLLTPVAKASFTENGFALANNALQVFGGHGYILDNGIEQTVRDSRITLLYEGTTEIQAIDLVTRKIVADDGIALSLFIDVIREEIAACLSLPACVEFARKLEFFFEQLRQATTVISQPAAGDKEWALRGAVDYQRLFSLVLLAFAWARAMRVVHHPSMNDDLKMSYMETAKFYFDFASPELCYRKQLLEITCRGVPKIS